MTAPGSEQWRPEAPGFRLFESSVRVGSDADWPELAEAVMQWQVKIRSGFTVNPPVDAALDRRFWVTAAVGPVRIREPVVVVATVVEPDRLGFAYGTLVGHPVSGEEAFIVRRDAEGVHLTLRSVTRPGAGWWRVGFGVALVAQRWYRRRYLRSLQAGRAQPKRGTP